MQKLLWLLCSLFTAAGVQAMPLIWQADNGDTLQLTQLESGEYWASLTLSDDHTYSFADNELILLQLDKEQPVSLVHGLRSCGSPARATQQIDYVFSQQDTDWLLDARRTPPPLPEGFVIKDSDYPTVQADRRAHVVDFPLQSNDLPLWPQWQSAEVITLRYSLDNGLPVSVQFDLNQH